MSAIRMHAQAGPRLRGDDLRENLRRVTQAWCFGAVFSGTVIGAAFTVFAKQLGATTVLFGVLTAIPFVAMMAQLPGSWLMERVGNPRRLTLRVLMTQRVLWLVVALLPLVAAPLPAGYRIGLLVGLVGTAGVVGSIGVLGWVAWMSDLVPDRIQGRYFSRRRKIALLVAVPAAVASGLALDWADHGGGEALRYTVTAIFVAAAICGVMDIKLISRVQWPHANRPRPRRGFRELLVQPLANAAFRRFLLFYGMLVVSTGLLGQYLFLYLLDDVGLSKTVVNVMFMLTPACGMLLGLSFWGTLIDRHGVKFVQAMACGLILLLPAGWLLVRPGVIWPGFLVMLAGGMGWSGLEQANFKYLLGLNGQARQTGYTALFFAGAALGGVVGAGIATLIASLTVDGTLVVGGVSISLFTVLFLLSAGVRATAIAGLLPRVPNATARSLKQSFRLMLTEAYQTLRPLAFRPIRLRRAAPSRRRRPALPTARRKSRPERRRRVGAA